MTSLLRAHSEVFGMLVLQIRELPVTKRLYNRIMGLALQGGRLLRNAAGLRCPWVRPLRGHHARLQEIASNTLVVRVSHSTSGTKLTSHARRSLSRKAWT